MERIANDISRSPQHPLGTIGGDQGTSFVAHHRAAMRVTSGYTLVASAFSSDPTVSEEAGQALGAEVDAICRLCGNGQLPSGVVSKRSQQTGESWRRASVSD
jgi:hypothetical protein